MSYDGPVELMLSEKILRERINKILDLVSDVETGEYNKLLKYRWGENTAGGDNDIIIDKAIKILKGEKIE